MRLQLPPFLQGRELRARLEDERERVVVRLHAGLQHANVEAQHGLRVAVAAAADADVAAHEGIVVEGLRLVEGLEDGRRELHAARPARERARREQRPRVPRGAVEPQLHVPRERLPDLVHTPRRRRRRAAWHRLLLRPLPRLRCGCSWRGELVRLRLDSGGAMPIPRPARLEAWRRFDPVGGGGSGGSHGGRRRVANGAAAEGATLPVLLRCRQRHDPRLPSSMRAPRRRAEANGRAVCRGAGVGGLRGRRGPRPQHRRGGARPKGEADADGCRGPAVRRRWRAGGAAARRSGGGRRGPGERRSRGPRISLKWTQTRTWVPQAIDLWLESYAGIFMRCWMSSGHDADKVIRLKISSLPHPHI
ncbi:hypothetical protein SETIT_6G130800v2 [Setaria italica]|uniref:Uncharacterized protein n=1 Tax=Setaria italica TaxID=4555 RepID=A0A368RL53_SETIT|nr:hypothetical protein SETIT_6G130800v2 [Setaria italica]